MGRRGLGMSDFIRVEGPGATAMSGPRRPVVPDARRQEIDAGKVHVARKAGG